ncbi:hypothetical protein AG0111_0g12382 [Alternaria gaisen]|uniref:Uncharacterized protein n=1 Tax=Alternaria gaisen TaxID=167740 RepID=A0ACB6F4X4_9PLEO|nr:hypothetical protein AG0111_0g12382 [Alternaria gaisen]
MLACWLQLGVEASSSAYCTTVNFFARYPIIMASPPH